MPYQDIEERRDREYRQTYNPTYPEAIRYLDPGPLFRLLDEVIRLDGRTRSEVMSGAGLDDRQFYRIREAGRVGLDMADEWCSRLGVPLSSVYPQVTSLEVVA